jgi:hypothetical protein
MATCECGIFKWECECGCGCICLSEEEAAASPKCWFLCEQCPEAVSSTDAATTRSVRLGLAAFASPQRDGIQQLSGATKVKFCGHGISLGSLALALDQIAEQRISAPVGRLREPVNVSMTATLDEVLSALGLSLARPPASDNRR